MTRALSPDLRQRVVAAMRAGASSREAAKTFSVSVASAVRWSQLERATGSTAPRPHGPRRRLVLLLSRYRWEATSPSRLRSALRVESVSQVQRRGWPAADTMLDLLAVTASGDWVSLDWASALDGATAIRIKVEAVDLVLEDLGEPWPSRQQPHHPD